MLKNLMYYMLPIFLFLFISSCKEKCSGEPFSLGDSAVNLDLKDSRSGEYLLKETNPLFEKALIQVTDDNNVPVQFKFVLERTKKAPFYSYYRLVINGIYKSSDSKDAQVCKRFRLKFDKESSQLDICFNVFKSECSEYFKTIDLRVDGVYIGTQENTTYITAEIFR